MGDFQWQALPIAKSGTQPVTADGKLDIANPAFVEASTWYAGLVTEKKVALPVGSASDAGWGEDQFSNGNAAMARRNLERQQLPQERCRLQGRHDEPARTRWRQGDRTDSRIGLRHRQEAARTKNAALKVLGAPAQQGGPGPHRQLRPVLPGPRRVAAAVLQLHRRAVPRRGQAGLRSRLRQRRGAARLPELVQGQLLHPARTGERLQRLQADVRCAELRPEAVPAVTGKGS